MSYTRKPGSRLYTPPDGYYDLPFTWAYDASALTPGTAYPNQLVYLQGGYGDFVLRRLVGLSRILSGSSTYQIRDRTGNYIESIPVIGASADDIGYAPELVYPELGGIRFDLGPVTIPAQPGTAQLAFQGARRMKGNPPANPIYPANPRTFTYLMPPANLAGVGTFTTVYQEVTDYDFELHQLILMLAVNNSLRVLSEAGGFLFTLVNPADTITLVMATPLVPQALSIDVVGSTITVNFASAIGGEIDSSILDVYNAFKASNAASALLNIEIIQQPQPWAFPAPPILPDPPGTATIGPEAIDPVGSTPVSKLWLYDRNKVQVSNAPILDVFMDGGPQGLYSDGALVPPLWYPKDSSIQIDVFSETTDGFQLLIYLVGKRWYPC